MNAVRPLDARVNSTRWSTTVGTICDQFGGNVQTGPFGSQLHASDYSDVGTPVVMPQDLHDGQIITNRIARVAERHVARLQQHQLEPGDIVYSRRGDVGRFAIVSGREHGWLCGTGCIRIRLNCPDLDIRYARRYLQQPNIERWLLHNAKGVTMPNLNTAIVRALPFVYPPLPEQQRIAAILDQADSLRAKRRTAIQKLDELTQSIFLDMFGDPATNPKKLPVLVIGDVARVQGGLQVTRKRERMPLVVPYLRVANVYRRSLDLREIKQMHVTEAEFARTVLQKDDLLIVEGHGNPAEIGRGALWDGSIAGCIHQNHLIRARFDRATVEPLYASAYINSPGGRRHLLRAGKTTSGLNTISVSDVRAAPIAVPNIALQQRFVSTVQKLRRTKDVFCASQRGMDGLFRTLQSRAFRGEL